MATSQDTLEFKVVVKEVELGAVQAPANSKAGDTLLQTPPASVQPLWHVCQEGAQAQQGPEQGLQQVQQQAQQPGQQLEQQQSDLMMCTMMTVGWQQQQQVCELTTAEMQKQLQRESRAAVEKLLDESTAALQKQHEERMARQGAEFEERMARLEAEFAAMGKQQEELMARLDADVDRMRAQQDRLRADLAKERDVLSEVRVKLDVLQESVTRVSKQQQKQQKLLDKQQTLLDDMTVRAAGGAAYSFTWEELEGAISRQPQEQRGLLQELLRWTRQQEEQEQAQAGVRNTCMGSSAAA